MKKKFSEDKLPTFKEFLKQTPNPMGVYVVESVWYRSNFKTTTIETSKFRLSRRHDQALLDLLEDFFRPEADGFIFLAIEVSNTGEYDLIFDDEVTLYDKDDIRFVDKDDWKYLLVEPNKVSKEFATKLERLFKPQAKPGNKKPISNADA